MLHKNLFIFDIETIPDTEAAKSLLNLKTDDVSELRKALAEYHNKDLPPENVFVKPLFHKIVAISFAKIAVSRFGEYETYKLEDLRSGGNIDSNEAELVQGFFKYFEKITPRLVSFNGRSFDMPVLKYRAMKHDIAVPFLYKMGDKWNSYNSRYSLDWHCDLLEAVSDFNASGKVRLNDVCAILGYPGKIDVDGSAVFTLYDEGKVAEIRDYCETDVLNTYLLYLSYALHRGIIDADGFKDAKDQVLEFLNENDKKSHFLKFKKAWQK
jgi:3'-5' exonuclease